MIEDNELARLLAEHTPIDYAPTEDGADTFLVEYALGRLEDEEATEATSEKEEGLSREAALERARQVSMREDVHTVFAIRRGFRKPKQDSRASVGIHNVAQAVFRRGELLVQDGDF